MLQARRAETNPKHESARASVACKPGSASPFAGWLMAAQCESCVPHRDPVLQSAMGDSAPRRHESVDVLGPGADPLHLHTAER